ncbi:MAG: DUF4160 domain-containing protein [Betaproteobacteria bacterium]|nr:DUF4160 domain-containing protein [Betaproteobacteria bacterium]
MGSWESFIPVTAGSSWCGGDEHPPVHAHVLHPEGKAGVYPSGKTLNSGVPAKALRAAQVWIEANAADVRREWTKMNNPRRR